MCLRFDTFIGNASRAFSRPQDWHIGDRVHAILSYHCLFLSGREPFLRSLGTSLFAMAAPALSARLFLTLINLEDVEGIVSGFLTDDKFIVQIAQANSSARGQARLHERRFSSSGGRRMGVQG